MKNLKFLRQSVRSAGGLDCLGPPKVKLVSEHGAVLWRTEP